MNGQQPYMKLKNTATLDTKNKTISEMQCKRRVSLW